MIINNIIINKDKRFASLGHLAQPVKSLFYSGDLSILDKPIIAIVGSRDVTSYGKKATYKLVYDLAKAGVVIISGLALGVDSIAHQACLDAGGKTIAVLPSNLESIYPKRHIDLANNIIESGGLLLSEYPKGQVGPQKYQFIARNRIIAALSNAVIVSEAKLKSGSLHTADFALEQGIDVYAVPGDIFNPNSEGTNKLIQNGAGLITDAQELIDLINI